MNTIRTGIIGVGNCASALAQGLSFYANARERTPGLITPVLGGYGVEAIEIVAAFDVTAAKAGAPLGAALAAAPNNTLCFAEPRNGDVIVQRGPTLDGIGSTRRSRSSSNSKCGTARTPRAS